MPYQNTSNNSFFYETVQLQLLTMFWWHGCIYVGDLPPEVDSEAWSSRRHFSLYFNLTSKYPDVLGFIQNSQNSSSESATRQQQQPQQQSVESGQSHEYQSVLGTKPLLSSFTITPNKAVNIISAKLRLYKAGTSDFNTDVSCQSSPQWGFIMNTWCFNVGRTSYDMKYEICND